MLLHFFVLAEIQQIMTVNSCQINDKQELFKMAVPKKKTSKARRDTRRAHHALTPVNASICPKCLAPKLHHHVCKECGYYKGREVIKVTESTT